MTSRPILLRAHEVRGILDGRQTMLRRVVKDAIPEGASPRYCGHGSRSFDIVTPERPYSSGMKLSSRLHDTIHCPFGAPGDQLTVLENIYYDYGGKLPKIKPDNFDPLALYYLADGGCCSQIPECACAEVGKPRWTLCPSWASRITLEITDVRVERLNSITGKDVLAEGVDNGKSNPAMGQRWENMQRMAFQELWESLHGPDSWDANPWVWVISFRRVTL